MSAQYTGAPTSEVKASYWFPDGENPEQDPKTSAEKIDSSFFTHLFCAFADLDAATNAVVISQAHQLIFSTFTEIVKIRNGQVKTLLSVGGRSADNTAFASMASKQESRKLFIDSWILIAISNGFHGIDLAWEYPNSDAEMKDFGALVGELRAAVDAEHIRTTKPTLLLTAAVYYSPVYKTFTYPVEVMNKSLDWVNVIAFDFFGSSTTIGPPAGLYNFSNPKGPCGDSGLKQWTTKAGLLQNKVVFGFPYVGWTWTLKDDKHQGDDIATTTLDAVSADGSINYNQISNFIKHKGEQTKMFYDSEVVSDNCISRTAFIGFDDIQSIVTKVRYTKTNGLLGYFAWNVGADDDSYLSRTASVTWDV
ncbi:PREDICTED: chitinase-3-like protein 2 [Camelina sativa]|uniref:Chitinase-3-like protein 2 n=1 Tax=Camelina sativa TaxID=90675 RepID=A0ABM0UDQ5_CAMSA|nr:PREDICTED: chitinase-3-like protein 2 [Camelina sativa]